MKKITFLFVLLFAVNYLFSQDTLQFGNGYWSVNGQVYLIDKLIPNADPKTFEWIKNDFSKDKKYVYFQHKAMVGCDIRTFQALESGYSKDKKYVYYDYYSGKRIENADPASFEVFDLSITKDKNSVYYFKNLKKIVRLKNVDAKTFHKICSFFRDKNYLYNCIGRVLVDIRKSDENYIRDITACSD